MWPRTTPARRFPTVESQINTYITQYGSRINGFFVDVMTNDGSAAHVAYYHSLYGYIKGLNASYKVIGNPGTSTVESYLAPATRGADILVTYENPAANYSGTSPAGWVAGYSPDHFANIINDEPTVGGMLADVQIATQRNVGNLYVTDEPLNPPTGYLYDRLPSYWNEEVVALASVPEPASWAMLVSAGAFLILPCATRWVRASSTLARTAHE